MVSYFLDENFTDALQTTNYVNGRLLTAEDLRADQTAMLERITQVARAGGHGVVTGLTVKKTADDVLEVTQGLGINKKGVILHLKAEIVAFSVRIDPENTRMSGHADKFQDCNTDVADTSLQSGAYVLAVRRSVQETGSAPVKSLNNRSDASSCASRWIQDGLEFRAIHLPDYQPQTAMSQRNRLAHACYGSSTLNNFHLRPFEYDGDYGLLYQAGITECDLPLAVFYYQNKRIEFVDMWAVRRRIVQPYTPNKWHIVSSDRRKAEGEARFYQFQEQIAQIQSDSNIDTSTVVARERVPYLPPFGYLPIQIPQYFLGLAMQIIANILDNYAEIFERLNISMSEVLDLISTTVQQEVASENSYDVNTFFSTSNQTLRFGIVEDHHAYVLPEQSWYAPTIRLESASNRVTAPVDILLTRTMYQAHIESLVPALVQTIFGSITNQPTNTTSGMFRREAVAERRVSERMVTDAMIFDEVMRAGTEETIERLLNVDQPELAVNFPVDSATGTISASIRASIRSYFKNKRFTAPPLYCMFTAYSPDTVWVSTDQGEKG